MKCLIIVIYCLAFLSYICEAQGTPEAAEDTPQNTPAEDTPEKAPQNTPQNNGSPPTTKNGPSDQQNPMDDPVSTTADEPKIEEKEENNNDANEDAGNNDYQIIDSDEMLDTPQVVDEDSINDDSSSRFRTVRLMLYVIAPISALFLIYFLMKGLKGHSRMFLSNYHIVGTRADNIELRPLDYESEEEDVVFDAAHRNPTYSDMQS